MGVTSAGGAYKRVDVETASQGKLIIMLFNGAIQRAEEAKRQMARGNIGQVHKHLVRAQDIIAELRGALDFSAGEVAQNLDRAYEYLGHLLVKANIYKDSAPLDECVTFMTELRDTWQALFEQVSRRTADTSAPQINRRGSTVMDLQG
ncbi:MAG: flagellar export chaperone FliS [Candidatus Hydrogenedentota bacterium]